MKRIIRNVYIYVMLLFLYAPIIVLMVYSFNASKSRGTWDGFTLAWYRQLITNSEIQSALYYTIAIAVLATIISTIAGIISSIGIYLYNAKVQKLLLNINYLPVINPDIVTGVSMMILFAAFSIRHGFLTMLIAHITFCIPYVILSILPKLRQMNIYLVEAAMDLGAKPWHTIKKVILPQIKPGIITGILFAFTLSIDDFVISFFTTGSGVSNLSIYVYSMAKRGISPEINALSTIMIVVVTFLLFIINKRGNKKTKIKGEITGERI
jgi:spermidine/putrescine transport system permease protein